MANWRCPALLREARHHPCQYCFIADGTIVAAHSNQLRHGKSMGMKASDCFVGFLCHRCHSIVDGHNASIDQQTRENIWTIAHHNTMKLPSVQRLLDSQARLLLAGD